MIIDFKTRVQGLFKFEVRNGDGELKQDTGFIPNLVLDQGLELIGTKSPLDQCFVGGGVTTPQKTDTALEVPIASTTSSPPLHTPSYGSNSDEGYIWVRKIFRFGQGQATGNISEVGVGSNGVLFNRSLVRDSQGLFATVTVMEDETLDVTVELRSYLDTSARQYQVTMSNVEYTLRTEPIVEHHYNWIFSGEVRAFEPMGYSGGIASRVGRPSGAISGWTGVSATYGTRSYVSGSKEKVIDLYWGLNAGNGAPLRTVVVPTTIGTYQTEFTPTIPKTSDHILKLTFKVTWDRYE